MTAALEVVKAYTLLPMHEDYKNEGTMPGQDVNSLSLDPGSTMIIQKLEKLDLIDQKLEKLETLDELKKLGPILSSLQKANVLAENRLKLLEARAKKSEAKEKVATEMLAYRDATSRELEVDMAGVIAKTLNGEVIATHYIFKGDVGTDMDVMVVGTLFQKNFVVFGEAKHSLGTQGQCQEAKRQVHAVVRYWKQLIKVDINALGEKWVGKDKELFDDQEKAEYMAYKNTLDDYQKMRVNEFKDYDILLAFGSPFFPGFSEQWLNSCDHSYLSVKSNPSGKLTAMF